MQDTILRLPAVQLRTGLSRSTIYARVKDQSFPAPVRLSARSVGWSELAVQRWIDQRLSNSESASQAAA
jgi:prophage regulatory protein